MLYTHNWGLFLGAGLALGLIPCWYVSEVRSSFWRDALIGFGGVGPALPALAAHAAPPGAAHRRAVAEPAELRRAGADLEVAARRRHADRRAGARGRGSGIAAILARRVEDKERTALLSGAVIVLGTLVVAWLVSQVSPAWTTRYLGVLLGPMLLLGALGLARAGNLGLVALVIIVGIWAIPKSYGLENKSNASDLRNDAVPELHEGDLVLSMQPEQGPLLAYHLEQLGGAPDLRFGNPIGRGGERPHHGLDGRLRQAEGRHAIEEPRAADC